MEPKIITGNDFYYQWSGSKPLRIVSLVPSLTEAFYYFGLNEYVVGVTKFCELPLVKTPQPLKIGGTKNPSVERIRTLEPDVIFASKEENDQKDVEALAKFCSVIVTDIKNINDNIEFLKNTGKLFEKTSISDKINIKLISHYIYKMPEKDKTVVYLIWKDPLMTVGGDTFINDMLLHAGLNNLYNHTTRYPIVEEKELGIKAPAYILLSSEPYPFKDRHIKQFTEKFPKSKVILADGQMFSWYGIRPLFAPDYFRKMFKNML